MPCLLSIVVPVYNEQQTLPRFLERMRAALAPVTQDYEIIFAADPGTDGTVDLIRQEHARDPRIKLLLFSRRFGQPASTLGGLAHSSGQAVVVIDCDLQDPPQLIEEMVRLWRCSNYSKTKCDFVSWDRPLAKPCPQCGAAFVVQKVSRAGVRLRCLAQGCGWTAEPDAEADAPATPDAKAS